MQVQQMITFTFFKYSSDSQGELERGQRSYKSRYLNRGRHPNLAKYEEVRVEPGEDGPALSSAKPETTASPVNDEMDRIGIQVLSHARAPAGATIAKAIFGHLKDRMPKVAKINLIACKGASDLVDPNANHSQATFDLSMLKDMLKTLISEAGDNLGDGLMVSGYCVNTATFDAKEPKEGYTAPGMDQTKVATAYANHTDKSFAPFRPNLKDLAAKYGEHNKSKLTQQSVEDVWRDGATRDKMLKGVAHVIPEEGPLPNDVASKAKRWSSCDTFDAFKVANSKAAEEFEKRVNKLPPLGKVSEFAGQTDMIRYLRNKIVFRYDKQAKSFKASTLADYTDVAETKEFLTEMAKRQPPKKGPGILKEVK